MFQLERFATTELYVQRLEDDETEEEGQILGTWRPRHPAVFNALVVLPSRRAILSPSFSNVRASIWTQRQPSDGVHGHRQRIAGRGARRH